MPGELYGLYVYVILCYVTKRRYLTELRMRTDGKTFTRLSVVMRGEKIMSEFSFLFL